MPASRICWNRPRQDDPGTTNAGAEPDTSKVRSGPTCSQPPAPPRDWRANDSVFTLNFPAGFTFPFYGINFSPVFVSTNGLLQFGVNTNATDPSNTTAEFLTQRRIAALWDDLTTALTGDDIFVDPSVPGQVTIRWNASRIGDNSDVQFAVTLVNTGEMRFDYGPGNANLTPTVGISAGDGVNFEPGCVRRAEQSGLRRFAHFLVSTGIVDIAAYEFQGDSGDTTPPTVVNIQPAGIASNGSVLAPVDSITVSFSEPIDLISARSPQLYEFLGDGLDGQFDTADDLRVGIAGIDAVSGSPDVTLHLNLSLPTDRYRLTLVSRPGQSLIDQAGNRLDGDTNGSAGGDYVRIFGLVTGVDPIADANAAPDQVAENSANGTHVGITASAVDPDPSDLSRTHWITMRGGGLPFIRYRASSPSPMAPG